MRRPDSSKVSTPWRPALAARAKRKNGLPARLGAVPRKDTYPTDRNGTLENETTPPTARPAAPILKAAKGNDGNRPRMKANRPGVHISWKFTTSTSACSRRRQNSAARSFAGRSGFVSPQQTFIDATPMIAASLPTLSPSRARSRLVLDTDHSSRLCRSSAAVFKGLSLPFSSGACEGNANRTKLINRQMYGRANPDLLRIRVIHDH